MRLTHYEINTSLLFLKRWLFVFRQLKCFMDIRGNHEIILNAYTILTYKYILYLCLFYIFLLGSRKIKYYKSKF